MDSLYIVIPAYNEEENIKAVVAAWYPLLSKGSADSRLVVADSGSTDQTHALLEQLQIDYPQLVIFSQTGKLHGPKVIALYKYAIEHCADFIFQTDSDGQTNPQEFSAFWEERNNYDGIFGNRTLRGDGASRAFVEKVVCFLLKIYFNVNVPDANAPFRLLRTATAKKYIAKLPADYNLPNIMLTTYFAYYQEKICFKVISFKPRQGGVNSINIFRIFKIGWKALGDFMVFKRDMR